MRFARVVQRAVVTTAASLATTVALVLAGGAPAHAAIDEITLTIVTPDLAFGAPACTTSFSMMARFRPGTVLGEYGAVSVVSKGCGPVQWVASVFVTDDSPIHGDRTAGEVSSPSNPATAEAAQDIEYGMGVRELAVIEIQYSASSRLGEICLIQRWEYDAVTWQIKPLMGATC